MSNTDDSDFTPRADESKESSSSDQDTLIEKNHATGEASKKRSAAQMAAKPAKKSYREDAVKKRFTDEIAKILVKLDEQLQEMELTLSLSEKRGYTKQAELADGKAKYLFDDEQRFAAPLTDETLSQLDDLFESLRIRSNYFLVKEDKFVIYKYCRQKVFSYLLVKIPYCLLRDLLLFQHRALGIKTY